MTTKKIITMKYVEEKITLPKEFFPAVHVTMEYCSDDITHPICVYGFYGNLMYEKVTNIYEMRDGDEAEWVRDIGEYLCENLD